MDKIDEDDFKILWENSFSEIGIAIQKTVGIDKVQFIGDALEKPIYEKYKEYRTHYKNHYGFGEDELIDRHKVSALITFAILDNEKFEDSYRFKVKEKEVLKKSSLSFPFFCGYTLLKKMILDNYKLEKNITEISILKKIKFPKLIQEKAKDYLEVLINDLFNYYYHTKTKNKEKIATIYCIRKFSHIFYYIENYNLNILKINSLF